MKVEELIGYDHYFLGVEDYYQMKEEEIELLGVNPSGTNKKLEYMYPVSPNQEDSESNQTHRSFTELYKPEMK